MSFAESKSWCSVSTYEAFEPSRLMPSDLERNMACTVISILGGEHPANKSALKFPILISDLRPTQTCTEVEFYQYDDTGALSDSEINVPLEYNGYVFGRILVNDVTVKTSILCAPRPGDDGGAQTRRSGLILPVSRELVSV